MNFKKYMQLLNLVYLIVNIQRLNLLFPNFFIFTILEKTNNSSFFLEIPDHIFNLRHLFLTLKWVDYITKKKLAYQH